MTPIPMSRHSSARPKNTRPRWVAVTEPDAARRVDAAGLPSGCRLLYGEEGVVRMVSDPEVDVVAHRHRRRGGVGGHLGGAGSGQDRRGRQQGNAGHGRPPGHRVAPVRRPIAAGG